MALSLKKDLGKSIDKGMGKLENTLGKIEKTVEETRAEIVAKEGEMAQLEEERRKNILEGEVLYAEANKRDIEKINAQLIRLNTTLADYELMQQEVARETFRELFPTVVSYRDEIDAEIKDETAQFIEGVKELYRVHLEGLNEKREQFQTVKSRWVGMANDLGITQYDITGRDEGKFEKLQVFRLNYTNLNDGQLMGLLNSLKCVV